MRPVLSHRSASRLLALLALLLSGAALAEDGESSQPTLDGNPLRSLLHLFTPTSPPGYAPNALSPPASDPLSTEEIRPPPRLGRAIDLTAETDNLWERIRNGFSMPDLNNDLVLAHQQAYMAKPEQLRRLVERSRPYMHFIVEELERRGMPTELALLPMVESAFNPMALSRAQASGLWQFIPSTGKRFNLEQNWWHDQRRDIVASTNAALDYLQTIYEMNGDWQLALASYNWGEGAVKRAMEKNALRSLPTDYASLTMPNETRHYVPKLQALKNIFNNPALMVSLRLPELLNRQQLATVIASRPIDINTAAKLAEIPVEQFIALNPAHNRPVIRSEIPMVIPADKVETFQNNLEQHDRPLSNWQAYTLKAGEKLDKLAPRFGIALNDLKRVNGLHGGLQLSPGSTVLVPATSGDNGNSVNNVSASPIVAVPEIPPLPSQTIKARVSVARTAASRNGKTVHAPKSTPAPGKHAQTRSTPATTGHKPATGKPTTRR